MPAQICEKLNMTKNWRKAVPLRPIYTKRHAADGISSGTPANSEGFVAICGHMMLPSSDSYLPAVAFGSYAEYLGISAH